MTKPNATLIEMVRVLAEAGDGSKLALTEIYQRGNFATKQAVYSCAYNHSGEGKTFTKHEVGIAGWRCATAKFSLRKQNGSSKHDDEPFDPALIPEHIKIGKAVYTGDALRDHVAAVLLKGG